MMMKTNYYVVEGWRSLNEKCRHPVYPLCIAHAANNQQQTNSNRINIGVGLFINYGI